MSVEQNKASMYRCFEEVWNKGNLAVIPEVISPKYVGYSAQEVRGLQAFEQGVRNQRTASPDLHYDVDAVVGEGDALAIRLTVTGTFTGKLGDAEPTGNHFSYPLALFNRYEDGKCVEAIAFADMAAIYRQFGIAPPTTQPAATPR